MKAIAFAETILGLIYPNICQICRRERAGPEEGFVCSLCRSGPEGAVPIRAPLCDCCGLPFEGAITVSFQCTNCRDQKIHFRRARAAAEFRGVIRETVHRYKYNRAIYFESFLAGLLREEAAPALRRERWDGLVPIPLHWTRRLERSFNQAERLARTLGKAAGVPVRTDLLRRVRRTETQTHMSRERRAENVKRAFAYRGEAPLEGARMVLIDDVLTTGATASACAKVLMDNGAEVVDVWTVARHVLR